jgi:hypothetical protein
LSLQWNKARLKKLNYVESTLDADHNNCAMNATFFDAHLIRLVQAPMAGSQNHVLAAAVFKAGGLGMSVFKWFETDGLISQRRDWLIGFKV